MDKKNYLLVGVMAVNTIGAAALDKAHPNILFVFADEHRRQSMGFMQEDPVKTPNFDKFASESLVFDNALSVLPLCSPYRASLMTGRYPSSTGVVKNCGGKLRLPYEEITIAEALKNAGYQTGYIGKWHLDLNHVKNGYIKPGKPRQGFDFWHAYNKGDKHFKPFYWEDSSKMLQYDAWSPAHETDVAIKYMKDHSGRKPFALFMSWNPPHPPFTAPEKFMRMYDNLQNKDLRKNVAPWTDYFKAKIKKSKRYYGSDKLLALSKRYFAAVSAIDYEFGRLMQYLQQAGLDKNTIVVYTSDHGEMMGSHGRLTKNCLYEEAVGIPFIIRWPGKIKSGQTKMLLSSPDVMPTLLRLAEVKCPAGVEGENLSTQLLNGKGTFPESRYLRTTGGKYRALRTERYVLFKEGRNYKLYDLKTDPLQLKPVLPGQGQDELINKLKKDLNIWLARIEKPHSTANNKK